MSDYHIVLSESLEYGIVISESNEYVVSITDAEALGFGLTPGLELVPSETLCPSNGINVQVTISGGS